MLKLEPSPLTHSISGVLGRVDVKWANSERRTHTLAQCLSRAGDLAGMDTSTLLSPSEHLQRYMYIVIIVHVHVHTMYTGHTCIQYMSHPRQPTRGSSFFLGEKRCAVLLCLVICLTLLASFFLPSPFSYLIKTCTHELCTLHSDCRHRKSVAVKEEEVKAVTSQLLSLQTLISQLRRQITQTEERLPQLEEAKKAAIAGTVYMYMYMEPSQLSYQLVECSV